MSSGTEDSDNSEGVLVQINANVDQVVEKLTGGLLEEAFGMGKDWLRAQRLRLMTNRLEGAAEMCRDAAIDDPEQVALSTLAPWIEGASIEDDPTLHEMWEALLASAGDPRDGQKQAHRSFVRILKQIETPDQKVLEALYQIDAETPDREKPTISFAYPGNEKIRENIRDRGPEGSMTERRLNLAKINLTRLGLCSRGQTQIHGGGTGLLGGGTKPPEPQEGPQSVHISDFGRFFYKACQPPEPKNGANDNPEDE